MYAKRWRKLIVLFVNVKKNRSHYLGETPQDELKINERIMYSIDIKTIESWKSTNFYQTTPSIHCADEIEDLDKMALEDNIERVNITPQSILNDG